MTGRRSRDRGTLEPAPTRVLLVEDDPQVNSALRSCLRELGYPVDSVHTLAEAETAMSDAEPAPDVVVTDIELPDGSGTDLAGPAAAHDPPIRMVYISANPRYAYLDPFLLKPFPIGQLVEVLKRH